MAVFLLVQSSRRCRRGHPLAVILRSVHSQSSLFLESSLCSEREREIVLLLVIVLVFRTAAESVASYYKTSSISFVSLDLVCCMFKGRIDRWTTQRDGKFKLYFVLPLLDRSDAKGSVPEKNDYTTSSISICTGLLCLLMEVIRKRVLGRKSTSSSGL